MKKQEKRRIGILVQVAVIFLIGILLTGNLTYVTETDLYNRSVKRQTEARAAEIADEVKRAVREYPAYPWLIRYWFAHADTLEIEYDADYYNRHETAEKSALFAARHPEPEARYLTTADCEALSEEDQKLYAELCYSWLVTRVDQIKRANHVDYLFCVISEEPFDHQFFLFSGAEPGAVRGTNYEEVYPLGHTVAVSESQTAAMRSAIKEYSHLADAGDYVDYYAWLCSFDRHCALIGLTYDLSDLRADIEKQTLTGATLAILTQLALAAICLGLIFFFVLRPLKKVQKSVRSYERTKDSDSVIKGLSELRSRNEIGDLAEDVSEMVREIETHTEQIRAITAEKERIGTELALATRIQAAMLPSIFPPFPERQDFDIYALMDPAKEVGGDFYDFFLLDDDHLALVIADVSGKGVPAALFMMVSKILVQEQTMNGLSPAKALETVNRQICAHNPEEMFVTVWLGVLELSTGRLTAANAGHEYPALKRGERFELFKDRHGFVIGGMDGVKYREYELTLAPGDKLFVYTDGVPEATDADNAMFGTERMLAALNEAPESAPEQILKNVREAVDVFARGAEQFDDLTMLCLDYRGPAAEGEGKR